MKTSLDSLFDRRMDYPDLAAAKRLKQLVGLDETKATLIKTLGILVNSTGPQRMGQKASREGRNSSRLRWPSSASRYLRR